jgi:hypothetical protein
LSQLQALESSLLRGLGVRLPGRRKVEADQSSDKRLQSADQRARTYLVDTDSAAVATSVAGALANCSDCSGSIQKERALQPLAAAAAAGEPVACSADEAPDASSLSVAAQIQGAVAGNADGPASRLAVLATALVINVLYTFGELGSREGGGAPSFSSTQQAEAAVRMRFEQPVERPALVAAEPDQVSATAEVHGSQRPARGRGDASSTLQVASSVGPARSMPHHASDLGVLSVTATQVQLRPSVRALVDALVNKTEAMLTQMAHLIEQKQALQLCAEQMLHQCKQPKARRRQVRACMTSAGR